MSEAISDDSLRKLLELESFAMPRPWRHYKSGDTFAVGQSRDGRPAYGCVIEDIASADDAAFVAASRNALRPLVEEVLRLRKQIADRAETDDRLLRDPFVIEKALDAAAAPGLREEVAALRSALLASDAENALLRSELSQTTTVPDCVTVRCSMMPERREE